MTPKRRTSRSLRSLHPAVYAIVAIACLALFATARPGVAADSILPPSPTPSATPSPLAEVVSNYPTGANLASKGAGAEVPGDCNEDGMVTVDELVVGVNIALGLRPLATCPGLDGNGDEMVTVDELIVAVGIALNGPPASPTPTPIPATRIELTSPAQGEGGVALTRETILTFSAQIDAASVGPAALHAEFAGKVLEARLHVSTDRRRVYLFYLEALPGNARIRVVIDGTRLRDTRGVAVDADGDGRPGGIGVLEFDSASLSFVEGTAVCGRVFASHLAEGDANISVNVPLAGVTIAVEGAEHLFAVTDRFGNFRLDPAPVGRFFVIIVGATAVADIPDGAYYPFVGKNWESVPGRETNVGDLYLPLIAADTLHPVSRVQDTRVGFPPSVLSTFPQFRDVSIIVPADSLFSDFGQRGGSVGLAPVPPDRLPARLPPGLTFPVVITVQTDGPTNFDRPAPACFPNLPDPRSGEALPSDSKSALWSFSHDTGRFEVVGPMTVSADGRLVCTDPGIGILAPGWHGTQPGVSGSGGEILGSDEPEPDACSRQSRAARSDECVGGCGECRTCKCGRCVADETKDASQCSDGKQCTVGDQCRGGYCVPGGMVPGCMENDCDIRITAPQRAFPGESVQIAIQSAGPIAWNSSLDVATSTARMATLTIKNQPVLIGAWRTDRDECVASHLIEVESTCDVRIVGPRAQTLRVGESDYYQSSVFPSGGTYQWSVLPIAMGNSSSLSFLPRFSLAGHYSVRLDYTPPGQDQMGCRDEVSVTVLPEVIVKTSQAGELKPDQSFEKNKPINFSTEVRGTNNANVSWTFPGGNPSSATGLSATTTYGTAGDYTVTTRVSVAGTDLSETLNQRIKVEEQQPCDVVILTSDDVVRVNQPVELTARANPSGGQIVWSLPQGSPSTSTANPVSVTYARSGRQTARVTYTLADGRSCSAEYTLRVLNPPQPCTVYIIGPTELEDGRTGEYVDYTAIVNPPRGAFVRWHLSRRGSEDLSLFFGEGPSDSPFKVSANLLLPGEYIISAFAVSDLSDELCGARLDLKVNERGTAGRGQP